MTLSHALPQSQRPTARHALRCGGHVGQALACALRPCLSGNVVETRLEALTGLPDTITTRHMAMPEAVVKDLAPGSAAIILTMITRWIS